MRISLSQFFYFKIEIITERSCYIIIFFYISEIHRTIVKDILLNFWDDLLKYSAMSSKIRRVSTGCVSRRVIIRAEPDYKFSVKLEILSINA